jgi:hypothetical protein
MTETNIISAQGRDHPAEVEVMLRSWNLEGMVTEALSKMSLFKIDGITLGFLQAMGRPMVRALQGLMQACRDRQYVPGAFRIARTEVMEVVAVWCLQDIVEGHRLGEKEPLR